MKYIAFNYAHRFIWSPPSRGAWIEIVGWYAVDRNRRVAPLAGGVD